MTRTRLALAVPALVVAALLGLAGCGKKVTTAEAVKFNEALVATQKRLHDAGFEFGKAAAAAVGGGHVELAMAARAHESAQEALERVRSELRMIQVPKAASAQQFHDAYVKMIAEQEKLLVEEFGAILKVLQDPRQTPEQRRRRIQVIITYLQKLERESLAPVRDAQAAFAGEFNITLRAPK